MRQLWASCGMYALARLSMHNPFLRLAYPSPSMVAWCLLMMAFRSMKSCQSKYITWCMKVLNTISTSFACGSGAHNSLTGTVCRHTSGARRWAIMDIIFRGSSLTSDNFRFGRSGFHSGSPRQLPLLAICIWCQVYGGCILFDHSEQCI